MGKGKTSNSKAALKKKERIELQKKMDARIAIVKVANDQAADPLDNLPSFRVKLLSPVFSRNSTIRGSASSETSSRVT